MSDTSGADAPRLAISADAWAQIATHMAPTPQRRARAAIIAAERQRQVERLLASGVPTRRLRRNRDLAAPFDGARMRGLSPEYDGTVGVHWSDPDGERGVHTVESPTQRVAVIAFSSFPDEVDYIVRLPGHRWLGSQSRTSWDPNKPVHDSAWVVDDNGAVLASGCLGDSHLWPVVTRDGTIFVPYFDEHPMRGCDGAWRRNSGGDMEFVAGSIRPLETVGEYSDEGRFSAGYTGMTVFDADLRVLGRHESPTHVVEIYASHTDGKRFWYVSYPEWFIDIWGPGGQENRLPPSYLKGTALIASGEQMARFSGPDEDRDTLYTNRGNETQREVVTFPDGTALRPGKIITWGRQLHYFDELTWYTLDAI